MRRPQRTSASLISLTHRIEMLTAANKGLVPWGTGCDEAGGDAREGRGGSEARRGEAGLGWAGLGWAGLGWAGSP